MRKLLAFLLLVACASAEDLYVDPTAAGSNNGSSWANAWTAFSSIQWGVGAGKVSAGDTLYISGGTVSQTYTTRLTVGASGSSGNYINLKVGQDAGHNGQVIFNYTGQTPVSGFYGIDIGNNTYINIDGRVGGVNTSKWKIINLFNTDPTNYGHNIGATIHANSGCDHITIQYIDADTVVNGHYLVAPDGPCEIAYCRITNVRGDAAGGFLGSSVQTYDTYLFHHNYVEVLGHLRGAIYEGPDGVQGSHGVSIYNNTFTCTNQGTDTTRQHPDYFQATGSYHKFYNNTLINIGDSGYDMGDNYFQVSGVSNIQIYNNLVAIVSACDPYPQAFRFYNNANHMNDVKIFNNLIVDFAGTPAQGAIMVNLPSTTTATGWEIKNNAWVNSGTAQTFSAIFVAGSSLVSGNFDIDYNSYQSTSYINFLGTTRTATAWIAFKEPHGKIGVPTYVSYTAFSPSNNFHLQASDTIDKGQGVTLSSFFTTDIEGVARAVPWDIGPYAYGLPGMTLATIGSSGTALAVAFSESISIGAGGNGGAKLTVASTDYTATYSSGAPGTTLNYTNSKIYQGATATITYTQPGDGLESTSAGIDVPTFTTQPVTNSSTQVIPPPTGPSATATGQSTITVAWTKGDTVVSAVIYRSLTLGGVYSQVGTAAANQESFGDTGLAANTTYYYKIASTAQGLTSTQTSAANATTDPSSAPNFPVLRNPATLGIGTGY